MHPAGHDSLNTSYSTNSTLLLVAFFQIKPQKKGKLLISFFSCFEHGMKLLYLCKLVTFVWLEVVVGNPLAVDVEELVVGISM